MKVIEDTCRTMHMVWFKKEFLWACLIHALVFRGTLNWLQVERHRLLSTAVDIVLSVWMFNNYVNV